MLFRLAILFALLFSLSSCADQEAARKPDAGERGAALAKVDAETTDEAAEKYTSFDAYWYRGLAEIDRYELEQARYDEMHEGHAVLIFVTEPFLRDRQVKYESGDKSNAVSVLKLNAYRRFYTGVYPYTMMTSTFTPAREPGPMIKLTTSVIEWCGMVFAQLNRKDDGYRGVSFSYFQSEGDEAFELPDAPLEDDLWSRIRIDPSTLPTGATTLVPSMQYLRLVHKEVSPRKAQASLSEPVASDFSPRPVRIYTVEYPELSRTLKIYFEPNFPHRIMGWEEMYPAIFDREGGEPQVMTTRAKLTRSIMLDYWNKNRASDDVFQELLQLTE